MKNIIFMNEAEKKDRESVWECIRREEPTFLESYDPTNNYHTIREIVLGGSLTWKYCNDHYKPQAGDRIMDIGANVGIYSTWCASRGSKVTAYECGPKILKHLYEAVKNLDVTVVPAAVKSINGEILFCEGSGNIGDVMFYNGSTEGVTHWASAEYDIATSVKAISFEEAIGEFQWDMIKIDIEGGEADILLHTPEDKLQQIKRAYIEFHPWVSETDYQAMLNLCSKLWNCSRLGNSPENRFDAVYLEKI